jgi:hypothetical protein
MGQKVGYLHMLWVSSLGFEPMSFVKTSKNLNSLVEIF